MLTAQAGAAASSVGGQAPLFLELPNKWVSFGEAKEA